MTRYDVIRMAKESGLLIPSFRIGGGLALGTCTIPDFERFAALVAAAEREACAKVCEEIEDEYRERESLRYAELRTDAQTGASDCAYRIRARGNR